jgi:hypothetical protein
MKARTEKKRQFIWFAALWGAGLLSCLALAGAVKLFFALLLV